MKTGCRMKNKVKILRVVQTYTSKGGSPIGYGGGSSTKGTQNLNFNDNRKKREKLFMEPRT